MCYQFQPNKHKINIIFGTMFDNATTKKRCSKESIPSDWQSSKAPVDQLFERDDEIKYELTTSEINAVFIQERYALFQDFQIDSILLIQHYCQVN